MVTIEAYRENGIFRLNTIRLESLWSQIAKPKKKLGVRVLYQEEWAKDEIDR